MKIKFELLKKTQIENFGNKKKLNNPIKKSHWKVSPTEQIMLRIQEWKEE